MHHAIDFTAKWVLEATEDTFAIVLRQLREEIDCSGYLLADVGEIDRPYLHRLEDGSKNHPSRSTVLKISAGLIRLGADVLVVDRLLLAAGHLPIFILAGVPTSPAKRSKNISKSRKQRHTTDT